MQVQNEQKFGLLLPVPLRIKLVNADTTSEYSGRQVSISLPSKCRLVALRLELETEKQVVQDTAQTEIAVVYLCSQDSEDKIQGVREIRRKSDTGMLAKVRLADS